MYRYSFIKPAMTRVRSSLRVVRSWIVAGCRSVLGGSCFSRLVLSMVLAMALKRGQQAGPGVAFGGV
jgi:hypothetical protein